MPNMTLSIPEDLHRIMKKHSELRWSEIARRAITEEVRKIQLVEKIASKSKLTMEDIEEINKKIKRGLYSKLKE